MTAEKLPEIHDVERFNPFTLRLADPPAITARHLEFMATWPAARNVLFQRGWSHEHYWH